MSDRSVHPTSDDPCHTASLRLQCGSGPTKVGACWNTIEIVSSPKAANSSAADSPRQHRNPRNPVELQPPTEPCSAGRRRAFPFVDDNRELTQLLKRWSENEPGAADALIEGLYSELHAIASRLMHSEKREVTLQPTAVLHEAFLRLDDLNSIDWQSRQHFLSMAARIMRRVLVDHARSRQAAKRDGGTPVTLTTAGLVSPAVNPDVLALHHALERFQDIDPEKGRIVELRVFAGLTVEETAEALGKSARTVKRGWRAAKAWLTHELQVAT